MKKIGLILSVLLLAACGFEPVYGSMGSSGDTAVHLSRVAINSIPDRDGQALRNHLIDRMYGKGRPRQPIATLDVALSKVFVDLGLQKDATTTRQEYNLTAHYVLKDMNGKELAKGDVRSIVGYDKLQAQYGTVAAQQAAIDRATQEVGEQLVNRLALYFSQKPETP